MLKRTVMTGLLTSAIALTAGQAVAKTGDSMVKLEDGTPVTVTGRVLKTEGDEFLIDYGQNRQIEVDLEDWNEQTAKMDIQPGSEVTVSGLFEDSFLGEPEINARSLYVHNTDTQFTLSSRSSREGGKVVRKDSVLSERTWSGQDGRSYSEMEPAAGDPGQDWIMTERTERVERPYDEGVPPEQRMAPLDYSELQTPTGDRVIYEERTITQRTIDPRRTGAQNEAPIMAGERVTGRVTGIHGRKLLLQTQDGTMGVDTALLPFDPAGGNVYPSIKEGDIVSFLGNSEGGTFEAGRVAMLEKPNAGVYEGQIIDRNTYRDSNSE